MDNKKQYRQFFTDEDYRKKIHRRAQDNLEISIEYAAQPVNHEAQSPDDREDYHPLVDMADTAADAILNELSGRSGIELDFDPETNHEIADTVAEIIRQGMTPNHNPYEQPPIDQSQFDMRPVDMNQPLGLFERAHVKWGLERWEGVQQAFMAAEHWARRTDVTERERCHGVAQAVYHQTGTRTTLDRIGQDVPLNPGQDYANFYESQFSTQVQNRSMRAAKDLFKE